jgi:hypothetical protein
MKHYEFAVTVRGVADWRKALKRYQVPADPDLELFRKHLVEIIQDPDFDSSALLDWYLGECDRDYNWTKERMENPRLQLRTLLEGRIGHNIRHLAIMPCSSWALEKFTLFRGAFPKVTLCDNHKRGQIVEDARICGQKEFETIAKDVDAFLISTPDRRIENIFCKNRDPRKVISYQEFAELLSKAELNERRAFSKGLVDRVNQAHKPLIVLCGLYYPMVYSPLLKTLERRGYKVFLLSLRSLARNAGLNGHLKEGTQFEETHILELREILWSLKQLRQGILMVLDETFFDHRWDFRRSVPAYAVPAALLKAAPIPGIINLYDVVRSAKSNMRYQFSAEQAYVSMIRNASGIILSSNTDDAGKYLKNRLELSQPIASLLRYNFRCERTPPKYREGFHIAIVGIFLAEHADPVRLKLRRNIRELIAQGIHVHYFSSHAKPRQFSKTLKENERSYFHLHQAISDQQELTFEVGRCHAGWMVHDTQTFVDLIAKLKSTLMRDLIYLFHLTTVPSCILLFGNAGIPVFVNRSMQGLMRFFPPDLYVPIEPAEVRNLGGIIKTVDWKLRRRAAQAARPLFSIENRAAEFEGFFERVHRYASEVKS